MSWPVQSCSVSLIGSGESSARAGVSATEAVRASAAAAIASVENGTNVRVEWNATYTSAGRPDAVISAFTVARVAGGRIVELFDVYDAGVEEGFAEWLRETGMAVDPSYC